jgi:hypothetical protein
VTPRGAKLSTRSSRSKPPSPREQCVGLT